MQRTNPRRPFALVQERPTGNGTAIPLSVPNIGGNAWEYVQECLDTNWVSSAGAFVDRFEAEVAERAGVAHAVATVSGTAALHLALIAAGVEPEDEVIVPALTFIASANAVRYCGAWPVLLDVEAGYFQLDPDRLEGFLREECTARSGGLRNRTTGRRVRAVMPVHLLGHPCDMQAITRIARHYDLAIVEDAAEAFGARHHGRPVGSAGDVACFSFNGNKIVTTGGGGMIVTADAGLAARARYLTTQAKDDPVEGIHGAVGFNYRLTNIQAALGVSQLESLDDFLAAKRGHAEAYADGLDGVPGVRLPAEAPWADASYWLYTIRIDPNGFGMDRQELRRRLEAQGIETRPLWQPLHRSPALQDCPSYRVAVADEIQADALSLPSSTGLSADDRTRVIGALRALARSGGP